MRPWNWLHNVDVPVVVAITEATWVSLALGAMVSSSTRFHMDLPFLAFATPAACGAAFTGISGRPSWRRWQRAAALAPVLVLGAAVTAGLLSELSVPASFGAVALRPWTVTGRIPSDTTAIAWLVAVLAWGRGTWLGAHAVSSAHAVRSVAVSALAFVVLFLVLATDHRARVHVATPKAALLFVVFFAGAVAALALVRERDIEVGAQGSPSSWPSPAWLAVISVPMLAVAGSALVVAVVAGPLASVIGRGVARAAVAVGSGLASLLRAIGGLFPTGHARPSPQGVRHVPIPRVHLPPPTVPHSVHTAHVSPVLLAVVVALLAVVGVVLVVLLLRWLIPLLAHRPRKAAVEHQVRDSVFSWGHLRDQAVAALRRWFLRLRRRRRTSRPDRHPAPTRTALERAGVREQYRRLLVSARDGHVPRLPSETTRELEQRLTSSLGLEDVAADLRRLTELYDGVRYGDRPDGETEQGRARAGVDQLVDAIRAHAAGADRAAK